MMASLRKNLVIISFINIPKIAILVKFYFTFLSHSLFWVLFWAKLFLLLFTEKITFLGLLFWVSLLFWVNLLFLSTFLSTFLRSFHLKHFFEYFFEDFFEDFSLWELFWVLFWGLFWGLFLLRTSLSTFLRTFLRTFFQLFWIQNLPRCSSRERDNNNCPNTPVADKNTPKDKNQQKGLLVKPPHTSQVHA